MKISTSGYKLVMIALVCCLGFGFQNSYGQSITSTSGSWFSSSTWTNGNAPGTSVTTSTRVVNPVFLDGTGGSLNLMSSANINSIINAPITDISSSGWSITFSNNSNNYLELNSTFYIKNNFDIAGGFPTTFAGNGYIGGTLSMQNNGGISLRIKSGYAVTVGGLNNYGGLIYIEPGASLIVIGNATISNNGSAGIVADGSLVVKGSLSVQGGSGISGTGTLTTPNPITLQNNGGATVFGQTYASTGGTISCSSGSPCNLSTNTVCSGVTVAIGASQSICSGATPIQLSTVSGTTITGAVTYQWVQYSASTNSYQNVSSGGTGTTCTPGALTQQTFYKLTVTKATCTTYSSAVTITVSGTPTISNANITGTTSFCAGATGLVYTVNGIAGASSYTWTFPSGFTVVTTNGNFATVNTSGSAVSGQISVSGVNTCGTSTAITLSVTVNTVPAAPGPISGSSSFCALSDKNVYSVPTIAGILSYTWDVTPNGLFEYSMSTPINKNVATVNSGLSFANGNVFVSATNACGTGPTTNLTVTVTVFSSIYSGAISGVTTICQGSMTTYSVTGGVAVTNYTWAAPSGVTLISPNGTSSTMMTVSVSGTTSGNMSVLGSSGCGNATASNYGITVYPTIAGTGAIIGSSSLCQSSGSTYTLSGLSNVSVFNWSVPSGFTISSGQGTSVIGVNISSIAGTGSLSISGSNTCGTSNAVIRSIAINSTPTGTGAFTGTNPVCLGASYNYTVTGLTNASSYNWTVPSGFTISSGQGTSVLGFTVASSASGGNMSISGLNVCGSGLKSMLLITTNTTPSGTGAITGSSPVCQSTSANYTVTGISNLSSFDWTVPSGFTISSGQGTSVIGVTFSSSASTASISISGSNTCGSGNRSTLSVTVNATPSGTGAITGSSPVCQNTSANYTVTGISNLSSFNWSVPSGITLNSGQGTSVIGVTFTSSASTGSISISGSNTCGSGNRSTLSVTVNATPSGTGAFSGSTSVCQSTLVNYTVTGISNASTLTWSAPTGYTISTGQGTSIIGVTFSSSAASGTISVLGSNTCGNGLLATQAISVVTVPSIPLTISGSLNVCQGQTNVIYNATVTNASSFNWGLPSGASITAGTGTNSITVTYSSSAASGILTVQGVNGICSGNTSSAYNITVNSSISSNTLTGFANTICWNTAPLTTLSGTTATGGSGSYTYLWESSTVSGTAGFISATGINTNASYVPGVLGTTTWYKRIVSSGSCSSNTSTGVSINVISLTGSWIGMNNNWNDPINWCSSSFPTNVFIDAGRPNYPIITVSGVSITDLTIANGASLTISAPNILTIGGNFLNSGSFTASSGTGVAFNGASAQSISGTNTFYNLTLAKSSVAAPVLLAGNTSLNGTLTLSANSKFVTTGYSFLLVSNINETARIASIPVTSTIVGNITMQRYVPAKLAFRFLSSAVTGSSLNDWKGNMFITGNGAGSDLGSSVPVVSQYNELLTGNQNIGFQTITSGTATPLQPGKGYRVFVRGDRSIVLTANYAPTITTLSVSGIPNIGPISLPLTYTTSTGSNVSMDGWNLVGNPYASQIDWNLITAGGANFQHIDNAIYILDPMSSSLTTAGQYLSYVNGVAAGPGATNANPNLISSSQAFFVHANAANPVLKIDENVKVSNTVNNHFKVEEIPNLLRIAISGTNGEDNSVIRFTEGATENFDSAFDAYKLSNTGPSIASSPYAGLDLSINSMQPLDTTSRIVALNISTPINGDHLLKFTSVPTFGPLVRIMLVDKYLNTTTDIEEGSTYSFTTTTLAGTKGNARFDVIFIPQLGSVKASLGPDSLTFVNSNLKWKLDTTWYNSTETANYIQAGTHTISFATVTGWITPASQQITVLTNTLFTVSGVYLPIPKTGSIHVKLIPESLEKGRVRTQWRINDGPWKNSSISSLDSLPVGNYTISFNDLNGWVKPQEITVAIQDGQETSITGEFIQIPDTSSIVSTQQLEEAIETDTSKTKVNKSADSTAVTGIADNATVDLLEISAYPNPIGVEAPVISIKGLNKGDFKLTVYNQSGILLYSKVFSQRDTQTAFQTRLEVFRELPDGLYLIQLMQQGHTLIKKIRK